MYKKKIVIILILLSIIGFGIYKTLLERKNSFDYIENAIVFMYKEDNKNTLKFLNKAHYSRDKDIYELINSLTDEDILDEFYKNKEGSSYGYAELKKARDLIFSNKIGEGIEKLKSSVNQGNVRAMSLLANYLYSLKRFEEAYIYFEMAFSNKEYKVFDKYMDMKNNLPEYINMEKLYFKYNQNKISDEQRIKLGKFLLSKNDAENAYKVLRPFLEINDFDARLAKIMYLEHELDNSHILKEYSKLYLENQIPKLAVLIAQRLDLNSKKNRNKILKLFESINHFDKDVEFIKANILYEDDKWSSSEEIYLKLANMNYSPAFIKLAKHYENKGELEKAIKMYKQSYLSGDDESAIKMYNIIRKNNDKNFLVSKEELSEYLNTSSYLGNDEAAYILATMSNDLKLKKKYALISFSKGNLKALELLIEIANKEKDKEKIKVYTNVLINNR